jgi:predicted transcriptional regulator
VANPPHPTDAELTTLRILWALGPSTVKEVHQELSRTRDMAYTGALRILQVMFEKGLVLRDESARSHVYRPAHSKDAMQKGIVSDLLEKAFSGSAKDLVVTALKAGRVGPAEKAEILALLGKED